VRGEVIETIEGEGVIEARVRITDGGEQGWRDPVFVSWRTYGGVVPDSAGRVLESDILEVYGRAQGLYTWTAFSGASSALPWIEALSIERDE
jgi:hypothetical protein